MSSEPQPNKLAIYQVTSQQWAHAEQIRWTLLYNYLMASTILLLAWATLFTCTHSGRPFVLTILASAGFLLSLLWIALGERSSGFVRSYSEFGQSLEANNNSQIGNGAFNAAKKHRDGIKWIASLAPSRFVLFIVPSTFAVVFFVFAVLSITIWCSENPSTSGQQALQSKFSVEWIAIGVLFLALIVIGLYVWKLCKKLSKFEERYNNATSQVPSSSTLSDTTK